MHSKYYINNHVYPIAIFNSVDTHERVGNDNSCVDTS